MDLVVLAVQTANAGGSFERADGPFAARVHLFGEVGRPKGGPAGHHVTPMLKLTRAEAGVGNSIQAGGPVAQLIGVGAAPSFGGAHPACGRRPLAPTEQGL